jgi:hypothetical protein
MTAERKGGDVMGILLEYRFLIPLVLLLGLAPFVPQPHIVEKLAMLKAGTLKRPIDIFDLFWHAWPFALLAYRIIGDIIRKS